MKWRGMRVRGCTRMKEWTIMQEHIPSGYLEAVDYRRAYRFKLLLSFQNVIFIISTDYNVNFKWLIKKSKHRNVEP